MSSSHRRKSAPAAGATSAGAAGASTSASATGEKMDATRKRITQMEHEREERRRSMIQRKEARKEQQLKNLAAGNPGDVDFIGMVDAWRREQAKEYHSKKGAQARAKAAAAALQNSNAQASNNICIAVRKRPISEKEREKLDHDSVSCFPPQVTVHSAKFKVDGITKYLTHNSFHFDHAFGDASSTEDIYVQTTLPLVDHVVATKGRATVFCYGQTGSGKTFTMNGIQQILAYDLYSQLLEEQQKSGEPLETTVAFFELYGGFIQDLLHDRQRCKLLEDGKGEVNITGLQEVPAAGPEDFLRVIDQGNSHRTTHTTEANDSSSRSHAICQVFLRSRLTGRLQGKLSLVDLAGSERGSDTRSHNSQRRTESADINTSLLSLKECIRALGQKSAHVPYRGSKLTLILKDCFSPNSKTTMIATVSPGASSTDHSLNTLRYADRIKEQRTTTTVTASSIRRSTATVGCGGNKSPRPPPSPSQKRLQLIANANQLARERRQQAGEVVLAREYKTLSPTGLVEPLASPSKFYPGDEDDEVDDEDLLLTDSGGLESRIEEGDDEDDDEDYVPSDDDENDDDHFFTPAASEEEDEALWDDEQESNDNRATPVTVEDEEEMRRIVQTLFELEESLLNQHMSNIQQHAEMLTHEGKLLQSINPIQSTADGNGNSTITEEEMDEYAIQLAEYLDRKEIMIYKLQQKLQDFQKHLAKEQKLSRRVQTLSQY